MRNGLGLTFNDTNAALAYALPVALTWTPPFSVLRTTAGYYFTTLDFSDFEYGGPTYYVDPINGSNSNSGLTELLAVQTVAQAITLGNATSAAYQVALKAGLFLRNTAASNPTITQPTTWRSYGTDARYGNKAIHCRGAAHGAAGSAALTFAQDMTYSNVYTATAAVISSVYDVIDTNNLHPDGAPKKLTLRGSIADVAANPNSYFISSTTIYVSTFDERAVNDRTVICLVNENNFRHGQNQDITFRDVEFWGGSSVFQVPGSSFTNDLAFMDCAARYSRIGSSLAGFHFQSPGNVYMVNCTATDNGIDGFTYTAPTTIPNVFEQNCQSYRNGIGNSGNTHNGSSTHSGIQSIRINGIYEGNKGPNVADTGTNTVAVILNCQARSSASDTADATKSDFHVSSGGTIVAQDCSTLGSTSLFGRVNNSGTYDELGGYKDGVGSDSGVIS